MHATDPVRSVLAMNCRLCNEKIPRMRALFKKSEFCCDEHAEQYKHQTLDRLLTQAEQSADTVAPLPLPPADDLPLASLESRTPLLEGQTVQGGPRRLPPPRPVPPSEARQSGFGGLLERLPEKKPAAASPADSPGNIGGWDRAGGEDPLAALMRLESAAPGTSTGLRAAPAGAASAFDSPAAPAASKEEDAISALRRLAEEARQTARSKPMPAAGAKGGAEDPFARLAAGEWGAPQPPGADDRWAHADALRIAPAAPGGESGSEDSSFDGLDSQNAELEPEAADGLSIFDRLVRDFDSDTRHAPTDSVGASLLSLPLASHAERSDEPTLETLPGDDGAPFAGSEFDRLMADGPRPKPAKAAGSLPQQVAALLPADSGAEARPADTEWPPTAAEIEPVISAAGEEVFAEPPAAEAVAPEAPVEPVPPRPETAPPRECASATPAKSRKAAPIEPKNELSDLAPAGWPNERDLSGDPDSVERIFAGQRASEAALHAPRSLRLIEPSRLNFPGREGGPAARSGALERNGTIPWRAEIQPAEIAAPTSPATDGPHEAASATEASEPLSAMPPLHMPDLAGANGLSPERFRDITIARRVLEIDSAQPGAIPSATVSLPPLECLPANGRRAGPPPLPAAGAAHSAAGRPYSPRLELTSVLPFPGPPDEAVFANHNAPALPPKGPLRLPAIEQNGNLASPRAAALPGAVAGLVGAEPRGSSFETADLAEMRRLVAAQTTSAGVPNGHSALEWNPFAPAEPFHPAFNLENGNRP